MAKERWRLVITDSSFICCVMSEEEIINLQERMLWNAESISESIVLLCASGQRVVCIFVVFHRRGGGHLYLSD